MKWIFDLRLGTRLILAFVLMAGFAGLVGFRGIWSSSRVADRIELLWGGDFALTEQIAAAAISHEASRRLLLEIAASAGSPERLGERKARFRQEAQRVRERLDAVRKGRPDEDERKATEQIVADLAAWQSSAEEWIRTVEADGGDLPTRRERAMTGLLSSESEKGAARISSQLSDLSDRQALVAKRRHDETVAIHGGGRLGTLGIIAFSVLFAVALGVWIGRTITVPLGRAVDAVEAMADGGLAVPRLDTARKDEIGELSRAIARSVGNLRETIGAFKSSSAFLAASADEISATTVQMSKGAEHQALATDETSSTMVEMAAQIDAVAKNSQSLASGIDETSSAVQEIASSIQQVAKGSETLLASVEETSTTIEEMTASIRAVAGKVKIVDDVSREASRAAGEGGDELTRVINGIGKSSKDIGKIVKMIEEIADQTNLLALNAAIEAARAGDAGRGFAVVAEEVKRLAERSMSSTREISSFVEAVQRDTDQAVDLTKSVLKKIVESVALTSNLVAEVYTATQEQASGANQIVRTAANMQLLTREVATGTGEQARGTKEIMRAVDVMNRMTQQVANASAEQKAGGDMIVKVLEQIALNGRQNLTATEELSKASQGLAREAERLQQIGEKFTL
jgi:methyl-accepting chemotaxis protein